ncbi:MAG TPA: twin-arginine translocase TatA/TatE family subunit [Bryobacteraceae bacterium]|nr:twin-arginine translocase TatA/TatE family subunit [Bryobacteraceae bacterium]
MLGPLGWQETVFIFLLALLLFGPKKLPELGKTVGKALTEFRRASNELKSTWDREVSSLERESESLKEVTKEYDPSTYDYSSYESSYYDSETQSYTSYDSTATETSSVSASATQGAESLPGNAPEGTVATTADGSEPDANVSGPTTGTVEQASDKPADPEKRAEA